MQDLRSTSLKPFQNQESLPEPLDEKTKTKLENELVTKVKLFYHLLESGMLEGKHGSKEANRRNQEILNLRQTLNITKKQQTALVNKASSHGAFQHE